jgi:hypothetical protein
MTDHPASLTVTDMACIVYGEPTANEEAIADDQLRKVVEWGDEICPETGIPRHRCTPCWIALRDVVFIPHDEEAQQ